MSVESFECSDSQFDVLKSQHEHPSNEKSDGHDSME